MGNMNKDSTFTHDGIRFHYRSLGSGRPFVFQHGLGGDLTQPFGLFRPPAGIQLLAFDARAHGLTEPIGDPDRLCFRVFAEDLLAFLDHLGIDRAIIGGISMGAALALHFVLRWPDRAAGLVLSRPAWLEGPCPWNVKMFTLIAGLIRRYGAVRGLEEFRRTADYGEIREKWPDVAESLAQQFQKPGVEENSIKLERIIRDSPHPVRSAWSGIAVPTLVLGNRLDPIHPFEYAQELARAIPGAEFKEVTSKSTSVDQHGADVQRALEDFLLRRFGAG
jgi:pimeloyl-ACP methyl ester carboxylesterase